MLTGAAKPGTRWSQMDSAYAIALQLIEGGTCSGCGQERVVSMDAASEFSWTVQPVRCHACATRERRAKAMVEGGAETSGLQFIVSKKETPDG